MQVTHKNQLFSKKAHHGFFISSNFDWHMGSKSQGSNSFSGSFHHPYNRCSLTVTIGQPVTRFAELLIKQTRTSFFLTSKILECVRLLEIELEHLFLTSNQ